MSPIFLKIGSLQIYWYSVILLFAFVLGIILATIYGKKEGIDKDTIYDYAVYLIPICLIGARLYYVFFNLDYYMNNVMAIIKVWEGGLAIHGGILAGVIYTYYYSKKHNISFLKFLDILVISLIVGQIIGRWGNFMNGEAYGPIVSLKTLQSFHIPNFIIDGVFIEGHYHHPTFLYESLWNLLGLTIILIMRRKRFYHYGYLTAIYLIWYGLGRFFIEGMRQDSLMLGIFKIAQIVSIGMIILGVFLFFIILRNWKKIDTEKTL